MNIVRKIHDQFRVKTVAGAQLETPSAVSYSGESSSTYITIAGGSLNGSSLSEEDRNKLNSIEQGAQVNQDAFSKVLLETTNIEQEQQTTTSSSIIANIPSDTANIRLVGNYPIKVSLESVSLFNYNTVTTTGDIVASYNVSYNEDSNIVIDYVSGTLFSTTDIEIIRIQHREETLATYNNTQFECTESEGTIIQFIIPYQGTDFSSIQFCRYETSSSESTEGTETVRELSVITELPVSPTKQQIITLSDTNANYWKYEEDENGNRYLWTDCNVYSTKEVSAYGKAEGQEMPTILNLSQLQDVALTNLSNNQVLVYNASSQKWVNIDANNLGISVDNLKTLTITVNGTSYTYNPASSNQSISITTITLDDILPYISNKLDREEFFKWFTINYDSDNNVTSIQANYDFYSIKGVSAYGLGDIGGITRTTLQSLDDVSLSNLVVDNMLAYNGSKWVNIPMSQVRGVTNWSDLENKPTTISGFGIVDAYTKTEVDALVLQVSNKLDDFLTGSDTDDIINKWKELEQFLAGYTETQTLADLLSVKANSSIQIIAGTGLVGGGDLTANRTISLSTSGVSADTYTKVTVDTYGRVTSGSTLSATDIPDLDWSKITSGKPTTLEGYGITDGVNSITITGIGNAITTATITDHILTLTKGDTFLQQSIFDDLFEKVNIGTTSDPIYAIKAKYHFYSVGEVSAYEFGDASGGGSGASVLYQLNDVAANGTNDGVLGAATGKVLMYNGSKWQAGSVVTDISTLTLQINGSALATFDGKSNVVANIAVPTKLSQLTDDVVSGKYLPLSGGLMTGQIRKNGVSSSWIKGRDNAMIRTSSLNGYSVIASIKTTNGTWEIGAYDQSSYFDDLIFSYCTDTNYSDNNNTSTAQIKFYEDGTIGASITGNAATASKWAMARTLTLTGSVTGSATMDGSGNVTLNTTTNHTHGYLPLSGGTLTGALTLAEGKWYNSASAYALNLNNSDVIGVNSIYFNDLCDNAAEGIHFYRDATHVDSLWVKQGTIYFNNYRSITSNDATGSILLHSGNYNDYAPSLTGTGASGSWGISISGNASTASKWQSARTLTLTGSVTGSVSIDGSANISMATTTNHTHTFASLTSKPTTISGYGITDAITKKFIIERNDFQHYVILLCKIGVNSTKTPHTINGTIWSHHDGALRYQAAYVNIHCSDWTVSYNNYYNFTPFGIGTKCRLVTCKYKTFKYLAIAYTNLQACTIYFDGSYSNIDFTPVLYYTSNTETINDLEIYNSIEDVEYNKLAFTSDNVASATQLQTSRTLWGQSFNGTANISGTLTGVGDIYMTDSIYNANNHNVLNCTSSFLILGYGSSANGYDTYLDGKTLYLRSGTAHNYVMTITSSGYVGIGTTSPACKLYVDGNIAATGEITAYSSSDIRLKTNLNKLNSLSIIRKLGVYSFDWNEEALQLRVNKNIHDYGLIAQQVQQYIPEVINTNMFNKGYLGIDYYRLVPFTISAIKEVDDEVTKLKKRVKQLERRLQKYESTEVFYTKGND